jgi:hypothetical protein
MGLFFAFAMNFLSVPFTAAELTTSPIMTDRFQIPTPAAKDWSRRTGDRDNDRSCVVRGRRDVVRALRALQFTVTGTVKG